MEPEEYDLIVAFTLEREDIDIDELNKRLTSKYMQTKEMTNATIDLTCQDVWIQDATELEPLHQMGWNQVLAVGFKTQGLHEPDSIDIHNHLVEYSATRVALLDDQLFSLAEEVANATSLGLPVNRPRTISQIPEFVILTPN